jgi:hypothetical protein
MFTQYCEECLLLLHLVRTTVFETSGITILATRHHVPDDWNALESAIARCGLEKGTKLCDVLNDC